MKQKLPTTFYEEIPFIRSIATLLVVLVHITASFYYYPSTSEFTSDWTYFLNQISRVGTPVFAVVSAFLLMSSVVRRGFNLEYFIRSRTVKIASPFIIWTCIYLLLSISLSEKPFAERSFLSYLIYADASSHLYFILTVIQFYILFPLLQMLKGKWLLILSLLSIILNYLWITRDSFQLDNVILNNLINDRLFLFNWIGYFFIGLVMARFYPSIKVWVAENKYLTMSLGVLALVDLLNVIISGQFFSSTRVQNLIIVPIFIANLMILFHFVKEENLLIRGATLIGNYSMGIYLVHPLVILLIKKWIPSEITAQPTMVVIIFVAVSAISICIVHLISLLPHSTFIVPIPKRKKVFTQQTASKMVKAS